MLCLEIKLKDFSLLFPRQTTAPPLYQMGSLGCKPRSVPPATASSLHLLYQHLQLRPETIHPVLSVDRSGSPTGLKEDSRSLCSAPGSIGHSRNRQGLPSRSVTCPSPGGLSSPTRHNPALQLALRGLTRQQAGVTRPKREPITTDVLQLLLRTL